MSRSVTGSKSTLVRTVATAVLAGSFVLACGGDDGPRTPLDQIQAQAGSLPSGHPPLEGSAPLSSAARSSLDSGNAAFRAKDYERALQFYRDAARAEPAHASPWFGVFMVAQATGNTALRDSAKLEVQRRTVDSPGVTDSTLKNTHPAPPKRAAS